MDEDYYHQMAQLQEQHWWYEGRRRILAHIISGLDLPEKSKILEAGCGPGANLTMLKNFGDICAFEPNEFAAKFASELSGLKVTRGTLPNEIPFKSAFSLIGAFDVIEHIEEDGQSLKALYEKTEKGGYAVFTVPAHQFLWSYHDEINHHKRRYSLKDFRAVLEQSGYQVEKISYYNMWLFPLAVLARTLKKFLGQDKKADVALPPKILNSILTFAFSTERHFLRFMNLPFGLSIIAVCHKSE